MTTRVSDPDENPSRRTATIGPDRDESGGLRVPTRGIRRSTAIGWIAGIVAIYDFILFGTLLPRITEDFGWSTSKALLISTFVSIGSAVAILLIGPLVDRVGRASDRSVV